MTDNYLATNAKTKQQQSSVSVFWDIQNVIDDLPELVKQNKQSQAISFTYHKATT
ncbi:MAG: hypothetical protein KME28_27235 [Pelatocladus maniniholoensis HA4357-MV3]|jgi:hypothetical protein|uniref:Uncharacterized protein n=1 Tax=Pelatocladus maniniholoensis HA4357-MV3 TaxID=1117104 RepID=A0A9E3HDM9_9NOST|nr:hypothetical protein [Pelatocladus maniniholoensis HA4357-MV3]BAZ66749.1 hypothetical protein NIES4106_15010 [Fischerella sp. NIES-4106]